MRPPVEKFEGWRTRDGKLHATEAQAIDHDRQATIRAELQERAAQVGRFSHGEPWVANLRKTIADPQALDWLVILINHVLKDREAN